MKIKIFKLFLILIFLALDFEFGNAYFYNITHKCKDDICIEGQTAEWTAIIHNKGRRKEEYIAIELVNLFNGSVIAELRKTFNPQNSYRGDLIVIDPTKKAEVNFSGVIPIANYPQKLIYYPCFTKTVTDAYALGKYEKYEERHCYKENLTMQVVQCISNENCQDDEICTFNACTKFKCGKCAYVKNHECLSYACCSPEQCGFDEVCKANQCEKLDCKPDEFIDNRTCKALNCAFDEHIINRTCMKLNCSADEAIINQTCIRIECAENEFIQDNKCALLDCKETEYAINHTCKGLICEYNQTFLDHSCTDLDCNFFQEIKNHACAANKPLIFKLSFEIAALMAIVTFLILDVRKYEAGHRNNKK